MCPSCKNVTWTWLAARVLISTHKQTRHSQLNHTLVSEAFFTVILSFSLAQSQYVEHSWSKMGACIAKPMIAKEKGKLFGNSKSSQTRDAKRKSRADRPVQNQKGAGGEGVDENSTRSSEEPSTKKKRSFKEIQLESVHQDSRSSRWRWTGKRLTKISPCNYGKMSSSRCILFIELSLGQFRSINWHATICRPGLAWFDEENDWSDETRLDL